MTIIEAILLITAGLMVGFINTLAGGGSIISLSVLMMLGLPATLANGTNRIAITIQTMTAVTSFSAQKVMDFRKGLYLAIPAVVGSVLGAYIAVDINEEIFEYAVAIIMLVMLVFILYKPQHWLKEQPHLINRKLSVTQVIIFFLIGLYGGFIHVGVGYFLLAAIVLSAGYELVKANAIKVLIVMLYTPFALVVFIVNDQVNWAYGLVMTIGNVAGAYIASHMAVKQGANFVRWVIVVVILLTSAHLFGIIDIKAIVESVRS
ncbi:MAG: sulfite exporter TauE/SafE family protein [Bacteroidales bacterium]|nr:sulfite exporter TauE/SafE family protein [Bacteroidales bacterium]NLO50648.1 sulfite exporter TauE/SafE family protein [Bacteroidales bacterium]